MAFAHPEARGRLSHDVSQKMHFAASSSEYPSQEFSFVINHPRRLTKVNEDNRMPKGLNILVVHPSFPQSNKEQSPKIVFILDHRGSSNNAAALIM